MTAAGSRGGAGPVRARVWEGRAAEEWRARWGVPTVELYERIESTNDRARALAEADAPAGTVVLADEQTAGRGRRGRSWHSPAGRSLLLSVVLRPDSPRDQPATAAAPIHVAAAVVRAVEAAGALRLYWKWPNDLLAADGRKVAGILCEAAVGGARPGYIVAGVGVNISQRDTDWPPELRGLATSVRALSRVEVSRATLADDIIRRTVDLGPRALAPLSEDELGLLADRDRLLGRRITIDGRPVGTAHGLEADGALVVRGDDGRVSAMYGGTVRVTG